MILTRLYGEKKKSKRKTCKEQITKLKIGIECIKNHTTTRTREIPPFQSGMSKGPGERETNPDSQNLTRDSPATLKDQTSQG